MVDELTFNDANNNKLPDYLSADITRIVAAVNGTLTLDVGGKGEGHADSKGNPDGTTATQHIETKSFKMVAPDGLIWVKSSDADVLIVDEDSGNDYGERKYALVIDPETLAVEPDGTGYFLAQAGGTKNPRAAAEASAYGGTFEAPRGSEFSGSWNVTALVARKADGTFYSQEELAGSGHQIVEQSRPLADHVFIGVVQQGGESAGAVEAVKADYGGQILMFSMQLPTVEPRPFTGSTGDDFLLSPDKSQQLTMIANTIFTGSGDDEVDIALSDGFENKIFSGSGADRIYAGSRDVVTGGSGNDWMIAESGDGNRLSGGAGDDTIILASKNNRALGGEGNDSLIILGGAGSNHLNGGAGADEFWLISEPGDSPAAKQTIADFKAGEDKVGLRGVAFSSLSFEQAGSDTLLRVDDIAVGHFLATSAATLNNQSHFTGLI
jgi:Ca2+-binding RTX toxin-like protein